MHIWPHRCRWRCGPAIVSSSPGALLSGRCRHWIFLISVQPTIILLPWPSLLLFLLMLLLLLLLLLHTHPSRCSPMASLTCTVCSGQSHILLEVLLFYTAVRQTNTILTIWILLLTILAIQILVHYNTSKPKTGQWHLPSTDQLLYIENDQHLRWWLVLGQTKHNFKPNLTEVSFWQFSTLGGRVKVPLANVVILCLKAWKNIQQWYYSLPHKGSLPWTNCLF